MIVKKTAGARRTLGSIHIEATAFVYAILEAAEYLRSARGFDGSPALRFDARWSLLRAIERCGGCPSFAETARKLRVSAPSARALILAAEKAGAVELFPDPHDRRALQVALTPLGRQQLETHRRPDSTWLLTLLNGLEPATMASTAKVLHVIRRRLESYEREMKRSASQSKDHAKTQQNHS